MAGARISESPSGTVPITACCPYCYPRPVPPGTVTSRSLKIPSWHLMSDSFLKTFFLMKNVKHTVNIRQKKVQ